MYTYALFALAICQSISCGTRKDRVCQHALRSRSDRYLQAVSLHDRNEARRRIQRRPSTNHASWRLVFLSSPNSKLLIEMIMNNQLNRERPSTTYCPIDRVKLINHHMIFFVQLSFYQLVCRYLSEDYMQPVLSPRMVLYGRWCLLYFTSGDPVY